MRFQALAILMPVVFFACSTTPNVKVPATKKDHAKARPYVDVLADAGHLVIRARGKEEDILEKHGASDPTGHPGTANWALDKESYRELVTWAIAGVIRHPDWQEADAATKKEWSEEGIALCLHRWNEAVPQSGQAASREMSWEEAEDRAYNLIAGARLADLEEGLSFFRIGDEAVRFYCKQAGKRAESLSYETKQYILVWSLAGLLRHADNEEASEETRQQYIQEGIRHLLTLDLSPKPY